MVPDFCKERIMRKSNATVVSRVQKLIGGLETYSGTKELVLNGEPVKCSVFVQQLQAKLDLLNAVVTAREAYRLAVAAAKPVTPSIDAAVVQVKAYAATTFGVGSEAYVAMGYTAPKRTPPTIETMAHAVVQSRATREARGTLGRKQKLAIQAIVPRVSLTPATTSTPSATASPAATGSSWNPSNPSGNGTPAR
jgi:hypothetical protein